MKIRTLEFLRRQKSAQSAENKGRHLRLLAKVGVDSGRSGESELAGRDRCVLQGTIFGCEHEEL